MTTSTGHRIECRAIVITGGIGTFTPRPLPTGGEYLGRGLVHFVPDPTAYAGQDIVVVGGGDSALDWALMLEPIGQVGDDRAPARASSAPTSTRSSCSRRRRSTMITDAQVSGVRGDPDVTEVDVTVKGEDGRARCPATS